MVEKCGRITQSSSWSYPQYPKPYILWSPGNLDYIYLFVNDAESLAHASKWHLNCLQWPILRAVLEGFVTSMTEEGAHHFNPCYKMDQEIYK